MFLIVTWRSVLMLLVCTTYLRSTMEYRFNDCAETATTSCCFFVLESQIWSYEHVVCIPHVDPVKRLFLYETHEWSWSRERPCNSWLKQVYQSCLEGLRMDWITAWEFARKDFLEWKLWMSEPTSDEKIGKLIDRLWSVRIVWLAGDMADRNSY